MKLYGDVGCEADSASRRVGGFDTIPPMRHLPLARKCGQNSYPPYPPPEVVRAPLLMKNMTPSKLLQQHREAIRDAVRRHRATNPRVFGSVARQEDREADLELLVDPLPQTTLFDFGGLQEELEELLGVHLDVRVPGDLPARVRVEVLVQARAL